MSRPSDIRTRAASIALAACITALAVAAAPSQAGPESGLGALSRRLQAGDLAAIDELLAATQPASIELADANQRAAALRAEVERLRAARATRPLAPPRKAPAVEPPAEPVGVSIDPLREARAWLRAGDPTRCLRALTSDEGEAAYLRARALEKLGREPEAMEALRRIVASAAPGTLRLRAAGDLAHLEWRARVAREKGAKP